MNKLSIIIPTYNHRDVLRKTLAAYRSQSAHQAILEILVVDDGSIDGTESAVVQGAEGSPVPIRHLRQDNRGQASARNRGICEARGEIALFGDDDMIPAGNLVSEHLAWHKRHPETSVGVLGHVAWSPEVHPTPFMKWLGLAGPLFDYQSLSRGMQVDCTHFYSNNISLKIEFLRENGTFDEDFRTYGYEDFELGYRLTKRGLRLLYNPDAIGYHYKYMSFADVCRRAELVEAAERVLRTKEAWVYLAERAARRQRSLKNPLRKLLTRWLPPALAPLKPLLDTQIPLPWIVYRALYRYYCLSKAEPAEATICGDEESQIRPGSQRP
jgi:glycosyltransferase involved in cell wall biosynthesis